MAEERVPAVIRGGTHDGLEGSVAPAVIEVGFLPIVQTGSAGEDDMIYGYRLSGVDDQGRHVFVPNGRQAKAAATVVMT